MGLISLNTGSILEKIDSFISVKTTSTGSTSAAVKLSYYEGDKIVETQNVPYTSANRNFHWISLSYGSPSLNWKIQRIDSNNYYIIINPSNITSLKQSAFTSYNWTYTTSVNLIILKKELNFDKILLKEYEKLII